jgi:hypothetical protein
LNVGESGEFSGREPQEFAYPVVDVRASRRRRGLLTGEELGNVGIGDLDSSSQISLIEAKLT